MRARMIAFSGGVILLYCVGRIHCVGRILPLTALPCAALLALAIGLHPRLRQLSGFLCFLLLGLAWADYRALLHYNDRLPSALEGRRLTVEGYLCSVPAPGAYGAVHFDVCVTRWLQASLPVPAKLRLSRYHASPSSIPDQGRFVVELKRPHGVVNPAGFRYETWLFRHGYLATGSARQMEPLAGRCPLSCRFSAWRRRLVERFEHRFDLLQHQPLVESLLFGVRGRITQTQWRVLQRTGTIHLIAISGLHVGLLAALTGWLSRYLWLLCFGQRFPPSWQRRFVFVAVMVVSGFYAALAGFSIPTQRALIMVAVGLLAVLSGRRFSLWTAWWLALSLVLVIDPLAPLDLGFWLSFAAVACLLLAFGGRLRPSSKLGSLIMAQLAIGAGLLPVLMAMGLPVATVGFLVNLLAIPWVSLIVMPLLFIAVPLGMAIPVLAPPLGKAMDGVLTLWWQGMAWAADHGRLVFPVDMAVAIGLAFAVIGLLWPASRLYRVAAVVTMVLVLAGPHVGWQRNVAVPRLSVRVFDVGEGTAVLVRTGQRAVLYGVGPGSPEGYNAATEVILPSLAALGVRQLDALILSRSDWKHRQMAKLIANRVPVKHLITAEAPPSWEPCASESSLHVGRLRLQFWRAPRGRGHGSPACVVEIVRDKHSVLIPGTLTAAGERQWLQAHPNRKPVDLLIAARQGSNTASSRSWVRALRPKWVLFSTGYRNVYHHPAAGVVARFMAQGAHVGDTAAAGSIKVQWLRSTIQVVSERRNAPFWIEKAQVGP